MSIPTIQSVRYVSGNSLLDDCASFWDECPFAATKSEQFTPRHTTQVLSLVDLKTFKCWVDERFGDLDNDGVDVSELKQKFDRACNELINDEVYVNLDSDSLIE
jgi:hypothetical protein